MTVGRRTEGEQIAHFTIVRHLASGGMGDVYEAVDTNSGTAVALKVLREVSPLASVRFEREGRIAAQLHHPHIAGVRARGRDADGTLFIAMDLLRGETLSDRLARGALGASVVVEIGLQVCDALEYAHARGVVHRDLKPDNIFLVESGRIDSRVLDFGIARVAGERGLTATGGIIGTLDYLSPEQARSERDIDHRTDLWSLGVVLYESLCGRVPFAAETVPSLLFAITLHDPPRLGPLCPEAPPGLVHLVERLLAKGRADRPPNASAVRDALSEFASADARRRTGLVRGENLGATTTSATLVHLAPSGDLEPVRHDEQRPVAAVYLRQVRDRLLVGDLAREHGGETLAIGGEGMLVVFGLARWDGDEPQRAVRFAIQAAIVAARIGVAAGRVVRAADGAVGGAIDSAVAVARSEGIWLDAATAHALGTVHTFLDAGDGRFRLDMRTSKPPPMANLHAPTTPFVGREMERAMLIGSLQAATASSQPAGVVVIGASGMGKTRLRAEALSTVESEFAHATVLQTRCEAIRRDASFVALRELCSALGEDYITRVFQTVVEHRADPQLAMDRIRTTLESVLRGAAARGPVLMVIDDAQWLDGASRAALRWIGENVTDIPLALWLFARHEGRDALRDVFASATIHELPPLASKPAADLVRAIVGDAPAPLLDRAAGLPLALEELARAHARNGDASLHDAAIPLTVESAIVSQIDRLESAERTALKCASVFGRTASVEGIVALGADADGVTGLRRHGFVSPRPRSEKPEAKTEFTIRSGLVREVAYGLWTDKQRVGLHARAAEWLRETGDATADEVARHFELAGDRERAAEEFVLAAERSAHAGDEDLSQHVARALALATAPRLRYRVLVAYDDVLQLGTDRAAQRRGLAEAEQLAIQLGDAERAEVAFRRAYFGRVTAAHDDALNAGLEAVDLAERSGQFEWAAAAENEIAVVLANEGRFDEAHVHARRAEAWAAATDNEAIRARSLVTRAYVIGEEGRDIDEAIAMHERAAQEYRRAGDRRREAIASSNAGHSLLKLGRIAEALERFDSAIALSQRVANARTLAVATLNRGTVYRMIGEWDRARADLDYSDRWSQRVGYVRLQGSVAIERAYLAICTSRSPSELISAGDEARRRAPGTQSPMLMLSADAVATRAHALAGNDVFAAIAALRDRLASPDLAADTRAELAVAVWEAGGRLDVDRAVALDALELWIATVARVTDRDDCRAAFTMRFVTDVATSA